MRHGNKTLKIGRTASHRKATLQAMSASLIEHKRIRTTLGKAQALRRFVEPVLTFAKDDSTASRRQAFRRLQNKEAVKTLYNELSAAIGDRPGGYTRIVKLGQRGGDAAEMAIIELVDFNDVKPDGASGTKRKTRRSRAKAGATAGTTAGTATAGTAAAPKTTKAAPAADAPANDAPEADAPAPADAVEPVDAATEDQAPAQDAEPPVPTGTAEDASDHGDAEQGAAPGTGEPPAEAGMEDQAGHRG